MPFKANADRRHRIPKQRRRITNWAEYDAASFSDRGCPVNSLLRHFSETGSSPYSIRLSRRVTDRVVAPVLDPRRGSGFPMVPRRKCNTEQLASGLHNRKHAVTTAGGLTLVA